MKETVPNQNEAIPEEGESSVRDLHPWRRRIFKGFLCVVILCAGLAGASYIKNNAPKARKRPPNKPVPLVRTMTVAQATHRVMIQGMGTVIPARQVTLRSRVAGEVLSTHSDFREGGLLKKGEMVVQIDPADYRLAIKQMESQVVTEEYELKLELGRQEVAEREWALLKDGKPVKAFDEELALRKPHLEKAKADLGAVQAKLEQARLDLSRTRVLAPFNSVILTKKVDTGSQISSQEQLAELVNTDEYWIQVSLPTDRLKWITIPRKTGAAGAEVRISNGNGLKTGPQRIGNVFKLLADMEEGGRMARLLVSVRDPLGLESRDASKPPLLIGEYVKVFIEGHALEQVFRIPRTALREDKKIWIAGRDDRLHIREVATIWRDKHHVLLEKGVAAGEKIIVSDLAAAVEGMAIRTRSRDAESNPDRNKEKSKKKGRS